MDSMSLFALSTSIFCHSIFMALLLPSASEEAYVRLGFSTQRRKAWNDSWLWVLSLSERLCGRTTDLAEPDLEMVAVRVAARHCELLGAGQGEVVVQRTCHLNKETEDASTL